ncbi:MAG TPA: threonyl-tRNA synthetase editing domain-containing protein [Candidatus Lokiarchaeia archaeon]|nr:threonyl-tRNA synthetase editing domain-containing protein [Candidatus Lokiarchaeia archaeon]
MRFLSFHVDYFWYKVSQRGRSEFADEITDENKEGRVENAFVMFTSMEKHDETNPDIVEKIVAEIEKITSQLKVKVIVINPFAHLFGELSSLEFAMQALKDIEEKLKGKGYSVLRIPFGWFNEIEMHAKGHPLSRIARIIE